MEPDEIAVSTRLNNLILGSDLPLFGLFVWDESAGIIGRYLMNTDRRFIIRESEMVRSVELFRGHGLSDDERVAELYFVLQAVLRMNVVNIIVFTTPKLSVIIRRLGGAIFGLKNSGAPNGSIYINDDGWVRMHNGMLQECGRGRADHDGCLVSPSLGEFRYGDATYASVTNPTVIERHRDVEFPGAYENKLDMIAMLKVPHGHITVTIKKVSCFGDPKFDEFVSKLKGWRNQAFEAIDFDYFGNDKNITVLRVKPIGVGWSEFLSAMASYGDGDFAFSPHVTLEDWFYTNSKSHVIQVTGVEVRPLNYPLDAPVGPELDYVVESDDVISELMTTKAGLAWNIQKHSVRMAAVFGQGRLGSAAREGAIWRDMIGVIICGERGENVMMKVEQPIWVAVDFNPLITTPACAKGALVSRLPRHRWLSVYKYLPTNTILKLQEQLCVFDNAVISAQKETPARARIVGAPTGAGKTTLISRFGGLLIDGDSLVTWPDTTERWWEDPEKAREVGEAARAEVLQKAYSHPGRVILFNDAEICDVMWVPELDVLKEHMALRRASLSKQPSRDEDAENNYNWYQEAAKRRLMVPVSSSPCLPWDLRPTTKLDWRMVAEFGEAWDYNVRHISCSQQYAAYAEAFGMIITDPRYCEAYHTSKGFRIKEYRVMLRQWRPLWALALSYGEGTMVSQSNGIMSYGFRTVFLGTFWTLHDDAEATFDTAYVREHLIDQSVRDMLTQGCLIEGNYLQMNWIYRSKLHRIALYSISNTINGRSGWQKFVTGTQNWTFSYPSPTHVEALVAGSVTSRVSVQKKDDAIVTTTSTSVWTDYMVDMSRVVVYCRNQGLLMGAYNHPDFLALLHFDEDYNVRYSSARSSNPRDGFINCWIYYSTILPSTAPWPSRLNTQTWWVKVPTASLRELLKEDADTQREVRGRAVQALTLSATAVVDEEGKWFGWLPEFEVGVDISGHAVSMLIMAGFGAVDIGRYWDTVMAITAEHFRKGKKSKIYRAIIRKADLTEDAVRSPFKLWHTMWDYRGAVATYILMGQQQRIPLHPRVIQYSLQRIEKFEQEEPNIKRARRKEFDGKVKNLYLASQKGGH
jgi:hypothetical protein